MRKTYRSKRDAPGALDHRDVMLTTDSKASLFDAFYIQNIKQTKKEVSVCSMQFAASNKVRKRKYVKRVKEKTPPPIESMSQSAYLTPDKSIHLNRAPDLFDQLLNSSPLETQREVYSKVNTHIQNKKTYGGIKQTKKINCWSSDDSSDSDKENSIIRNSSDIKSHKLLIENKTSPIKIDESIKNIFNDLSVFKLENCSPINLVQSPIISRVKRNRGSVLNTSPLCSTPFKDKYRGKSIYKFSPISTNPGKSHNNQSVVFENDEIDETDNDKNKLEQGTTSTVKDEVNESKKDDEVLIISHVNEEESLNVSSVFETTEQEPFLGFPEKHESSDDEAATKISKDTCHNTLPSQPFLGFSCSEEHEISSTNATSNSISNESLYDTCSSEDDDTKTCTKAKRPVIVLDKLSDSIFNKYYKQIPNNDSESSNEKNRISEVRTTEDSNSTESNYNSLEDEVSLIESMKDDNDNKDNINESSEITKIMETATNSNKTKENVSSENIEITDVSDSINETDSSNSEDSQETCISFVTTRRRNKATNDFTILTLDNSCTFSLNTLNNIKEVDEHEVNCDNNVNKESTFIEQPTNLEPETIKEETIKKVVINSPPKINVPKDSTSKVNKRNTITTRKSARLTRASINEAKQIINTKDIISEVYTDDSKPSIVLQPGKKWERSLSIYRRMTTMADHFDESILEREDLKRKGRKYRQSVICTMQMQENNGLHNESISSRRSTFAPRIRPSLKLLKDDDVSRLSICSTNAHEDLQGFLNEDCDDTVIELSKLSIADCDPETTIVESVHDTSHRALTAREYVLRRCDQTDAIPFDECYPDSVLKNCRKIGEGVYGEVFLWRARDGQARVLKVIPVAGNVKVNGEHQKDFGEIISEIVIAMELSALRTPIAEIEHHIDEGKNIEALDLHSVANATDVFNKVIAVRCVYGSYPSRLLDLWELYDETRGSENDNPATLPEDQQFIVLELGNAGQDLESYQFANAEQAYSIFKQVAYGLAVAEEAFQFEHRDLHWGNVLIQPTDEKYATFVLRGRSHRVARRGVAATVIDYSLSRVSLRGTRSVALYHDLAADDELFNGRGDYQFELYRLMRRALGNNWENYEPYTNVLWLHYTVDKMITALRYTRTTSKTHRHHITKLTALKDQLLNYRSATELVLTHNEL